MGIFNSDPDERHFGGWWLVIILSIIMLMVAACFFLPTCNLFFTKTPTETEGSPVEMTQEEPYRKLDRSLCEKFKWCGNALALHDFETDPEKIEQVLSDLDTKDVWSFLLSFVDNSLGSPQAYLGELADFDKFNFDQIIAQQRKLRQVFVSFQDMTQISIDTNCFGEWLDKAREVTADGLEWTAEKIRPNAHPSIDNPYPKLAAAICSKIDNGCDNQASVEQALRQLETDPEKINTVLTDLKDGQTEVLLTFVDNRSAQAYLGDITGFDKSDFNQIIEQQKKLRQVFVSFQDMTQISFDTPPNTEEYPVLSFVYQARVGCVLRTGYKVPRRLVRGTHPTLAGRLISLPAQLIM
ncbi:MAG: hypothetical protein ABFS56_17285 [Pseudomonadota bacterium]